MRYFFTALIGYLIGSFPTAYFFMKRIRGLNITEHGSGNVGTLNAYEVSGSKSLGTLVLVLDLFKGILSIYFAKLLFPYGYVYSAIALFFAVAAHCYSPWIKFKGGRGLAAAAGGFALLSPLVLVLWLILWGILQVIKKNIHFSNFFATVFTLIIVIVLNNIFNQYSNPPAESNLVYVFSVFLILLIIIIKHIEPIKEYFRKNKVYNEVKSDEEI